MIKSIYFLFTENDINVLTVTATQHASKTYKPRFASHALLVALSVLAMHPFSRLIVTALDSGFSSTRHKINPVAWGNMNELSASNRNKRVSTHKPVLSSLRQLRHVEKNSLHCPAKQRSLVNVDLAVDAYSHHRQLSIESPIRFQLVLQLNVQAVRKCLEHWERPSRVV